MLENKILMRSYKEIKNKHKHLKLEKEFEDDNYLVQTLKRTSKIKYDAKIVEDQNNLKSLLSEIYNRIRLENDPLIKVIKTENDDFQKDYRCLSENFQKSTNIIFRDLIRKYNERGYKIPNLTYQHNLFKINALIEDNNDKLELALNEDKKNKNPMIVNKTLTYIKKMKYIINLLSNKDKEVSHINNNNNNIKRLPKFTLTTNIRKNEKKNNETNEEIKQSIEKLKILIDKNPILNTEQRRSILLPKRRPSFVDRNAFNSLKLKVRKSSNDNTRIKNNDLRGVVSTDYSMGKGGDKKNEFINMLSKRTNSNESNKSNRSSNSIKSNKSVNSQKEVINNANKRKKEDILFFAPSINTITNTNTKIENSFNVKDIFNRNTKPLINLKSQVKSNGKENQIERTNTNTLSMVNSDKESTLYNKKTCYSNTINDNYKKIKSINSKRNIKTNNNNYIHYKPFVISLKKNKIRFKNISNDKKKNSLKLNQFISRSMALSKTPKVTKSIYLKTQPEANNKPNKNSMPYNLKDLTKTQKIIYKRNSDNKTSNDYLQKMYKRLQRGNYSNIEGLIRKYLKDIKLMEQEKEELLISHYNYKNLKTNLTELNRKISLDDVGRKTERIYINNQIIKRVLPLLRTMKDKEINIDRFEKIVSSGA